MSARYGDHLSLHNTPQSESVPGRNDQVQNSVGGYVFTVTPWVQLDRFLILGCEGGTYYASERKLTKENAQAVLHCLTEDGPRVVARAIELSDTGRAPKNDPALFVLALATVFGDDRTKAAVAAALHRVARIPTHLFHYLEMVKQIGGHWGRRFKTSIAQWYLTKKPDKLAEMIVKYPSRDGWSHRDVLRLAHPKTMSAAHNAVFRYATHGMNMGTMQISRGEVTTVYLALPRATIPNIISGIEEVKELTPPEGEQPTAAQIKAMINLIHKYHLQREMLPTQYLNHTQVWEALLPYLGITAMIRNLGNMSKCKLLTPLSNASRYVCEMLRDGERLKQGRVHPISILMALDTYGRGKGLKGSGEWKPDMQVQGALDDAFYLAFAAVEPTNKRIYIGNDISGSMGAGTIAGTTLTPRQGVGALSMLFLRTEQQVYVKGFSHTLVDIPITPKHSLMEVCRIMAEIPMGDTDCALPMIHATRERIPVDLFLVQTDNETWYGGVHPYIALLNYRQRMGIPAKMVVVGMRATNFTIADPRDAGMMDVVGFDSAAPQLITDFIRG